MATVIKLSICGRDVRALGSAGVSPFFLHLCLLNVSKTSAIGQTPPAEDVPALRG